MTTFNLIASVGHCGTMWLSRVLNAGTDARWFHELRLHRGGPWLDTLRYGPGDRQYDAYWKHVRRHLWEGDVGDANSWPPVLLLDVNEVQAIDRVIYLRRNPIQQVHSLATRSYVWSREKRPTIIFDYINGLYQASPLEQQWPFSAWEKVCFLVASNYFMPDWLRQRGLPVETYTLETLTTDTAALMQLAPNLLYDEARRWQQWDVNRKVRGKRDPAHIWAQWTDEQRAGFERVVGAVTDIQGLTEAV